MIERGLVLAIADDVVEIPYLAHEIRKQRQFDVMTCSPNLGPRMAGKF
jgi:hypothetical protein